MSNVTENDISYFRMMWLVNKEYAKRTGLFNAFVFVFVFTVFQPLIWNFIMRDQNGTIDSNSHWLFRFAVDMKNSYRHTGWVWLKVGRLYIRDIHSCPDLGCFKWYSKKHLFLWCTVDNTANEN